MPDEKRYNKYNLKWGLNVTKHFKSKTAALRYMKGLLEGPKFTLFHYEMGPEAYISDDNTIEVFCPKELVRLINRDKVDSPKAALVIYKKEWEFRERIRKGLRLYLTMDEAKKELEKQYREYLDNNPELHVHKYRKKLSVSRIYAIISDKETNEIICKWNVYPITQANYTYKYGSDQKVSEMIIK